MRPVLPEVPVLQLSRCRSPAGQQERACRRLWQRHGAPSSGSPFARLCAAFTVACQLCGTGSAGLQEQAARVVTGPKVSGSRAGRGSTCSDPFVQSPRPHALSSPTTTDTDEDASAIGVRFAREPSSHTQSHQGAGSGRRWPAPCGHSTGLYWTEDGERGGRIESGGWPEHAC